MGNSLTFDLLLYLVFCLLHTTINIMSAPDRSTIHDVTDSVLTLILQHVPQADRMRNCARVSSRFSTAAIAASSSVRLKLCGDTKYWQLVAWLQSHKGAAVTSLRFESLYDCPSERWWPPTTQLHCPALLKLRLRNIAVQLTTTGPCGALPGLLHGCTSLTSLQMLDCTVLDTPEQLAGLSALRGLQELVIRAEEDDSDDDDDSDDSDDVDDEGQRRRKPGVAGRMPGALLSQLVQLSRIELAGMANDRMQPVKLNAILSDVRHVGCVTALQHLHLQLPASTQSDELAGLLELQQLTHLELHCAAAAQLVIGPAETPAFRRLTALKRLFLKDLQAFNPAVLMPLKSLQLLHLEAVDLQRGSSGHAALLAAFRGGLQQLTKLNLDDTLKHRPSKPTAYTALAALNHLRWLSVSYCDLPACLWLQLAAAGFCMPALIHLQANELRDVASDDALVADFQALACCFPNLRGLECWSSIRRDMSDLSALKVLTELKALKVDHISDTDVPGLALLTTLRRLALTQDSRITAAGLLQLTALTRLRELRVHGELCGKRAGSPHCIKSPSTSSCSSRPDADTDQQATSMPEQLLLMCMEDPASRLLLAQEVLKKDSLLAQAKAEVAVRDARLAAAAPYAASRQQLLDARAAHLAEWGAHTAHRADELSAAEQQLQARLTAAATREQQLVARVAELDAREWQLQQQRVPTSP